MRSIRLWFFLGFLACAGLLAYAYYVQFVDYLDPCPLCILQRIAFIATGVLFLIGALHGPSWGWAALYATLITVTSGIGAAIAGRHVWLQNLPPEEVPACGPGLDYMLDNFPLGEALRKAFTGSGECATVDWQFLGLSMPTWTLIWFLGLIAYAWFVSIYFAESKNG